MIRVSVSSGPVRFRAEVRAKSIEEVVRLAAVSYLGREVKVLFPIDAEVFFIEESALAVGTVVTEVPKEASR
jgi:hypothetical protein